MHYSVRARQQGELTFSSDGARDDDDDREEEDGDGDMAPWMPEQQRPEMKLRSEYVTPPVNKLVPIHQERDVAVRPTGKLFRTSRLLLMCKVPSPARQGGLSLLSTFIACLRRRALSVGEAARMRISGRSDFEMLNALLLLLD